MFLVEIGLLRETDEELALVSAGSRVCHTQHTRNMFKLGTKLILKSLAKHTLPTRARSGRIASLQAEILDQSMKTRSIKIPLLDKFDKILTCFGHKIRMHHDVPIAQVGLHLNKAFEFVFLDAFVYFLADLVLFEVAERCGGFVGRSETGAGETRPAHVCFPPVLVQFVFHAPLNEPFDVVSGLKILLDFLFFIDLFLFFFLFELSFEVDFFHDSCDGLVLLDFWLDFLWRDKRDVVLEVVELSNVAFFHVFGVLDGDDVVVGELVV